MDQPAQNGSIEPKRASLSRLASLSSGQFFRFLILSSATILLVIVFFGFFKANKVLDKLTKNDLTKIEANKPASEAATEQTVQKHIPRFVLTSSCNPARVLTVSRPKEDMFPGTVEYTTDQNKTSVNLEATEKEKDININFADLVGKSLKVFVKLGYQNGTGVDWSVVQSMRLDPC
jgi:hypothetical protein